MLQIPMKALNVYHFEYVEIAQIFNSSIIQIKIPLLGDSAAVPVSLLGTT